MVILENKDKCIFNLPKKIADIVYEFQTTKKILITTNNEGLCLRSTGLYEELDYVADKFQIPKNVITIQTCNAEEYHNEYEIQVLPNHWIDQSKAFFELEIPPKDLSLKTVGCFIGKPNWHRLIIASWLYNNHKLKTLMTCHYDPNQERHQIDSELTEINRIYSEELPSVVKFLPQCPIYLTEGFLNYTIGPPTHYNIISEYRSIFLDLVIETYIAGISFFPTEKTLRPIIAKTPFVVMGPAGYLSNLQRMGFKTFSKWWDEGYDNFSNRQRIIEIKKILTEIFSWSDEKIKRIHSEMEDILLYNRCLLEKISGDAVLLSDSI